MVWPALVTSSWASSSTCASTTAANARSNRALSDGATSRHAANASCARPIAASVSSTVAEPTSAIDCPVTGLITSVDVLTRSHPFEGALELPVGDSGLERLQLDVGHVDVVLHHVLAQGRACHLGRRKRLACGSQVVRHVRLV